MKLRNIFFRKIITILILTISLISCNNIQPSGFWKNFKSKSIESSTNNQGPWGGERNIHWKFNKPITTKEIIDFAEKNKWIFVDSLQLTKSEIEKLNYRDDYSNYLLKEKAISKLNFENHKVLRFKTGWISVEPGNLSDTNLNGFAILNSENKILYIHHSWGE